MKLPLTAAIVGFGNISAGYADDPLMRKHYNYCSHIQVLSEHPAYDLIAIVDPDHEARKLAKEKWSIDNCFESMDELFVFMQVDILIIATPVQHHLSVIRQIKNVKAVVIEKPIGIDLKQSREIVNICDDNNILLQVNLWRRADQLYRDLADSMLEKYIGVPQVAYGVYGNGLLNNAVHMIDFVNMLFGNIVEVQSIGQQIKRPNNPIANDPDQGFVLKTENEVIVTFLPINFDHYREISLDIWGTEGRFEILLEGLVSRVTKKQDNRAITGEREINPDKQTYISTSVGEALWNLYDNLHRTLAGKESLWSAGKNAIKSEMIVESIGDSVGKNGVAINTNSAYG